MTPDSGFVDLRLNRQEGPTEESFWPSFTDIMTVVVMIFLLAMVVLLVRNMELVHQLRATMEAERMAAELARSTSEEKDTLSARLISAESELSMLRMQVMRYQEQTQEQSQRLTEQQRRLSSTILERDRLAGQVNRLTAESMRLNTDLADTTDELQKVNRQYASLREQEKLRDEELAALRLTSAEQRSELERYREQLEQSDVRLTTLQEQYSDLKIKYDKLVRPARSSTGKYVVEVRYRKSGGRDNIAYKRPQDADFRPVSRRELDRILSDMKARHKTALYVKVIIPKDSGLSYNEAWSFTSHLLKSYDYYYQEGADRERIPVKKGE
jgi:myosin heavy subunit